MNANRRAGQREACAGRILRPAGRFTGCRFLVGRFTYSDTPLTGLKLVQRRNIGDHRGFLDRLFCAQELLAAGWLKPIVQVNHTCTRQQGTVRGLHYQYPPHSEMKLVTCLRGAIWDVAVDLRPDSRTYLSWHAEELSPENQRSFLIPEGFAHGFQALTSDVEMLYLHSAAYSPEAEAGLHPADPRLDVTWPLPVTGLSDRDAAHPLISDEFKGVPT